MLKVCIVGCGRIATLNIKGYLEHPDAEVVAVCDTNPERANAFAKEYGIKKVYLDYEDVLSDSDIDAVDILVPHHLHCSMTVRACKAGKHVSVQKPMAMSLEECDQMIEAAKEAGVQLKVFENFIFYPPYVKAKELLDAGEIGEPITMRIKMNAGSNNYGWPVDRSTWIWRMQEELSGGGELIFDDGYHKFSIARYFLGDPDEVFAFVGHTPMEGELYFDKNTGKNVQFYEDAPSIVSWTCKGSQRRGVFDITYSKDLEVNSDYYACDERVEITGTKGVIWITRCTGKMLQIPTLLVYKDCKLIEYNNLRDDWADSFIDSTKDFVNAIKENRPQRLSGEDGKEVLKFSLAALRAGKENRPIKMDVM